MRLSRAPARQRLDSRFRGNDGGKGQTGTSFSVRGPSGDGLARRLFKASIAILLLLGAALPAAAAGNNPLIVVLGDSLTAGLGLPPEQAFPVRLAALVLMK